MKKVEWKDATSYSRDDNARVPAVWDVKLMDDFVVTVHRHRDYPGAWLLTCHALNVERMQLDAHEIDAAKAEALTLVKGMLHAMTTTLQAFVDGKLHR